MTDSFIAEARYVRQPGPEEFRGTGTWVVFTGTTEDWEYLTKTGYLPIGWRDAEGLHVQTTGKAEYDLEQATSLAEAFGGSDD